MTEALEVEAARAVPRVWPTVARVQGNLIGDEQTVVGTKVAGRVWEVLVDLGSTVEAGEELAELDPEEFELRVEQARARLEQARAALGLGPEDSISRLDRGRVPTVLQERATYERARGDFENATRLAARQAITQEEARKYEADYRVAQARFEASQNSVNELIAAVGVAEAELRLATQARDDARVKAPFGGIVAERHVAPGMFVQVGRPMVTLVRADPLRFRAQVPERIATRVRTGQELRIFAEGAGELEARITRTSPSLDLASRSLIVEADVPNPDSRLRAGLFAEAEIVLDPEAKAVTIPRSAVTEFAGLEKVWVLEEGQATERRIRTGRRSGDAVEVLEGLREGDLVALEGHSCRLGPVEVTAVREIPGPEGVSEPGSATAAAGDPGEVTASRGE